MERVGTLVLIAVAVALRTAGGQVPARLQSPGGTQPARSSTAHNCPPNQEIDDALGKASSLLQQEQYRGAVEALEKLTRANCDPRAHLLLAAALEATGDSAKAEELLQRAHSIWPSNNSVSASLAREYMKKGRVDDAVQALGSFKLTAKAPLQEMKLGVVVYLAAHRLVPALAVAETAYQSYPSLDTLLLLANVLQLQGRYKDVNRLLQDQRKDYANSPAFLITFAESENDAMLWEAARADLEQAIALDSNSHQAHYLLGNVLASLNKTERAESEYRTAIQLAPNQPRAFYQLALLLRAKQDDAGEASLLSQALAADDHYAPAYCEMGRILLSQHRLEDAVTQLNRAIQYNPQLEQAYYLLARAYAGLGQKDKADAVVKRYTQVRAANRRSSVDERPGQIGVDK